MRLKHLVLPALLTLATPLCAMAEELRLLTWGGYAPADVVSEFEEQTGIKVLVTLSNNEDMISKLRATGGAGFDLAQPSQDRVISAQQEYRIYKPMDLDRIDSERFIVSMLTATWNNTSIGDDVYGVPHVWGTTGLIVHESVAQQVTEFADLCKPQLAGRVSYRLRRPILIGMAFSMGEDPFAAYGDPAAYESIMMRVQQKLIECKRNVKTYWSGGDELIHLVASGEVLAAKGWDAGGWKLQAENPAIRFVAPSSGALGWIDTFVLPRRGRNDDAAYQWINFVMHPEIAARITQSAGNFTASKGAEAYVNNQLKASFEGSFDAAALDNIKWYPPVPQGLETLESRVLDRIGAAN
jgi:spermidine/putrescine transport system substrate-binding protein